MKITTVIVLATLAAGLLFSSPARPCEYSIRDVAFVTYEVEYYRIFFLVDSATSEEVRGSSQEVESRPAISKGSLML